MGVNNLTIEEIHNQMNQRENIRNISILSYPDHGKSTLLECLNLNLGINIKKTNNDSEKYVKSTISTLSYKLNDNNDKYLINLIDTQPYSTCFEAEYASELRITDSLLLIVDCVESSTIITSRLESKLRVAVLSELLKPSLFINKLDRLFLELQDSQFQNYLIFEKIIYQFNNILSITPTTTTTTTSLKYDDEILSPIKGNVFFGSALHGWGFSIETFAKFYSVKFGVPVDKLISKLWGENFFNAEKKRWQKVSYDINDIDDKNKKVPLKLSFIQFILEPIMKIVENVMNKNNEQLKLILKSINIILNKDELKKSGKELLILILKKWLPLNDNLLNMVINKLPSPIDAQKYRVTNLYEGLMNDEYANSIRECNPNGPLMFYISKLIPSTLNKGRYYLFGRIFSGSIHSGGGSSQKVKILNSSYNPLDLKNKKNSHSNLKIKDILFINDISKQIESISGANENLKISCGNLICIFGIDTQYIDKSSTIIEATTSSVSNQLPYKIKSIKYSSTPIIKFSVDPINAADLPKLHQGLRRLVLEDSNIMSYIEETGENIICVPTQRYIEKALLDLSYHTGGMQIKSSDPFVSYRESVSKISEICLSKTPNRHSRLYMSAEPLSLALQSDIEKNYIDTTTTSIKPSQQQQSHQEQQKELDEQDIKLKLKERSDYLVNEYGWNRDEALQIWSFGPNGNGINGDYFKWVGDNNCNLSSNTCILVNCTKGVYSQQHLVETKDHIINGFRWAVNQGALCDEPMKGIKFNLVDIIYVADAIHRGGGQIIPASRRVIYASQLSAGPTLNEPWYLIEISTFDKQFLNEIYNIINNRRGIIINRDESKISSFGSCSKDNLENDIFTSSVVKNYNIYNTIIKAHLPVSESFDFERELRSKTRGVAYLQSCLLDHWSPIGGGPVTEAEYAKKIVSDIRKRKGLKNDYPDINTFLDRL